ncbi:MlaD family protein [Thalassotalea sp. G2M2-11]|uniref:PqiB family protein n=1 Tax=Thalassotalea sp. G2M2-11 TaxID=2787627 RepID=UPI0019D1474C|nr:MlaD family protein [Thalassotalea sp. G2M2-11]
MSKPSSSEPPKALVQRKQGVSAIWLVPAIALIFGAWLLIKAYQEQGTMITVQFDNARGIVVGKTEVKYKGLTAGIVRGVEVSEDLQSIIVEVEMIANASNMLTDNTLFWYVTADVSFQGVSGLETLFSGSYINIQPDIHSQGVPKRHFVAIKEPPMLDMSTKGLHITLEANQLGSLNKDSLVTFKQITVGRVSGFKYSSESDKVEIGVFIEPEYAHLVNADTRFWHSSGIEISGSLTAGVNIQTESLSTMISGGIAFDNPIKKANSTDYQPEKKYILHDGFQSAQMGYLISLTLNMDAGIDNGAPIRLHGLTVGKILTVDDINANTGKIIARALINPRLTPYLTTDAQFFVMTPKLNLTGTSNMQSILTGPYIGIRPATKGELTNHFTVYNQQPPYPYETPGLHLTLTTNDIASLKVGTGIYYQQQKVGSIQAIAYSSTDSPQIHIHIKEQFQHLVSKSSQFWQMSGVQVSADLTGIKLQTHSLQSALNGAIAFNRGDTEQDAINGDTFALALNQTQAMQHLKLTILAQLNANVDIGTKLFHQGQLIGEVHHIIKESQHKKLNVGIFDQYQDILRENTHFTLVNPRLSLVNITDASMWFNGSYILVNSGGGEKKTEFTLASAPRAKHLSAKGLQLTLTADRSYGLLPGSTINVKGIEVGQIDSLALNSNGEKVTITLTIDAQYQHLVNHYTRFYNTSGIRVKGSLNQISVQADSLDTILKGGLSFFTPKQFTSQPPVDEGQIFHLFANQQQAEKAGTAISIHFNDIQDLAAEQLIKFHGQTIGHIERIALDKQGVGATAYGYLADDYRHFAVSGSQFWHSSPKLNLINPSSVKQILAGTTIQALPGNGEQQTHFQALDLPPAISSLSYGLNLTLSAQQLGAIKVGVPVMYRQVLVGKVIGIDLAESADQVDIFINIAERYRALVSPDSKFWRVSGFELEAGFFSGIELKAESIENILTGGIAFATPAPASSIDKKQQLNRFVLYAQPKASWLAWSPKIQLKQ